MPRNTITDVTKPTIEQIIETPMYQVVAGKAYLKVAAGLAESDPVILGMAKTFFAMTLDSHLYSSLMYAARIHDTQRNAVTMKTLLQRAKEEKGKAKYGAAEVEKAVSSAESKLAELEDLLESLKDRRNQRLAHNDPRTPTDPSLAAAVMQEDYENLKRIFAETGKTVNEFSRLFRDVTGILEILDQEDYKSVIEVLFKARWNKCTNMKRNSVCLPRFRGRRVADRE